jgi:membrane protein YdbS with pleckstrin-like domain
MLIGSALIAMLVAAVWVWTARSWDAISALATAVVAFVATVVNRKNNEQREMQQNVKSNSVAIQSGRDTHIENSSFHAGNPDDREQ